MEYDATRHAVQCVSSRSKIDLPDGIEVRAVGRQEEEACLLDGAAHGLSLVAAEIVEDYDVALGETRR